MMDMEIAVPDICIAGDNDGDADLPARRLYIGNNDGDGDRCARHSYSERE